MLVCLGLYVALVHSAPAHARLLLPASDICICTCLYCFLYAAAVLSLELRTYHLHSRALGPPMPARPGTVRGLLIWALYKSMRTR